MKLIYCLIFALTSFYVQSCFLFNLSKPVSLKIGMNPWPGYEPIKLASTLGYFEKHGIDVEVVEFGSLNDVKTAYLRGTIDIMCSTIIEAVELKALHGIDSRFILVPDYSNGADEVLARNISSVKELKGKSVGVEIGTVGDFLLRKAVAKAELKPSDIDFVAMEQSDMQSKLSSGEVAAIVAYPPVTIQIKNSSDTITSIFSSADIPYEVVDVLSIKPDILDRHPEVQENLWKVWKDVLSYIESNRVDAIASMAKREKISPKEFEETLNDIEYVSFDDQRRLFTTDRDKLIQTTNMVIEMVASKSTKPIAVTGDSFIKKP